jgi:hypothetical protein
MDDFDRFWQWANKAPRQRADRWHVSKSFAERRLDAEPYS